MLSRILRLIGGRAVRIQGTDRLAEGQSRRVEIGDPLAGGTEIVLCRLDGKLRAVDRRCPHEGGRIGDGPLVEGRYLRCPLHEYKFDPASGRAVGAACRNARTYRVRERGSDCDVWV